MSERECWAVWCRLAASPGSSRQETVVSVSAWPRVGVVSAAREGESLKERATRDAVMGGRGECENGESVEVVRVRV